MTRDHTHRALSRLTAIAWEDDEAAYKHANSRAALMLEYMRRAALWAQLLGATKEWPFFDIANHVDPHVRADPATVNRLNELSPYVFREPVRRTVESILHWATLQDLKGNEIPDLPEPYEPLLLMFERGGDFNTEHGFIDFGYGMLPIKTWQERLTPPRGTLTLDPATLDAIDLHS